MAARAPTSALFARFRPEILRLARFYVAARAAHPQLKLTSWWRSREHNAATSGSAEASQHLAGTAIDVVGIELAEAQRIARALGLTAIASQRGAVHVQALPSGTVARLLRAEPELFS